MSTFEEVKVSWKGQEAAIPANGVLRAIAKVESVITVGELGALSISGAPKPLSRIAMAYGLLLRHAGIKVDDDDIYNEMFASGGATALQASALINTLISLMVPPAHLKEEPAKKDEAATSAAGSSLPPTGPQ